MDDMILVRLSRLMLRGMAVILGSLGIFCLYWSWMGAGLANCAILSLGTATAITLLCGEKPRID
jgi:hypothetical protein